MTMLAPRHYMGSNRPAYLDSLFTGRDPNIARAYSSTSSISTSSTTSSADLRSASQRTGLLPPQAEEDNSDGFSTRSKRSFLTRRNFRLGTILNRRTYPQSDNVKLERPHTSRDTSARPSPTAPPSPPLPVGLSSGESPEASRRPSLPELQTSFPPPQAISTYAKRPLPAVPQQQTQEKARPRMARQRSNSSSVELSCQPCYYFTARNCQGYVLGGEPGDPCETCLQAGYFGAK